MKISSTSVILIASFLTLLFIVGCSSDESITVNYAIKHAEKLDDKEIKVSGFLSLEHEDFNLYASKRDYIEKIHIDTKCISLSVTQEFYDKWSTHSGEVIEVSGILDKNYCEPNKYCPSSCNTIGLVNISGPTKS